MTWATDIDRAGGRAVAVSWRLVGDVVEGDHRDLYRRAAAAAARDGIADLTLDEFTLAAVCSSEDGDGSAEQIAAICDATLNRAARAGRSVWLEATGGKGLGRGRGGRPMSTARRPELRHVRAAVAVSRGPARGCSGGARAWFHPRTQDALHRRDPASHCPARVILERWCWGSEWADRGRCKLGPRKGPALEWVGPLQGVDATHVLMFRGATALHSDRYEQAARILGVADRTSIAVAVAVLAVGALS